MSKLEQTLSIVKPYAVERKLIEKIKSIFLKNNLTVKDSRKIHLSKRSDEQTSELQSDVCSSDLKNLYT